MIVYDLFKNCDEKILAKELRKYSNIFKKEYRWFRRKNFYKKIRQTLDDMLSLTPILCDDFIYVVMCYDLDEEPYLAPSIVHKQDILKYSYNIMEFENDKDFYNDKNCMERPEPYSLMFIKREELLGYQFSELSLKKYNKYEVIAAMFYELTWFGYDNETYEENSEKEQQELEERVQESKEHPENLISYEDAMNEIFGKKWKKWEQKYVPPTKEELDKCIQKNRVEVFEEYSYILKLLLQK